MTGNCIKTYNSEWRYAQKTHKDFMGEIVNINFHKKTNKLKQISEIFV